MAESRSPFGSPQAPENQSFLSAILQVILGQLSSPPQTDEMRTWDNAQARLSQGRVNPTTPNQPDTLTADSQPEWMWQNAAAQRRGERPPDDISAIPLGDPSDPVSFLASLLAPGVSRGVLGAPALLREQALKQQLRGSVLKDEAGNFVEYFHGTPNVFPKFDGKFANNESLYGPGIYTTDAAPVASGYAGNMDVVRKGQPTARPNVRPVYPTLHKPFNMEAESLLPEQLDAIKRAAMKTEGIDRYVTGSGANRGVGKKLPYMMDLESPISAKEVYEVLAYDIGKEGANALLKEAGFDGIVHIGGGLTGTTSHNVAIAFDPKNVVSSFGLKAGQPNLNESLLQAIMQVIQGRK